MEALLNFICKQRPSQDPLYSATDSHGAALNVVEDFSAREVCGASTSISRGRRKLAASRLEIDEQVIPSVRIIGRASPNVGDQYDHGRKLPETRGHFGLVSASNSPPNSPLLQDGEDYDRFLEAQIAWLEPSTRSLFPAIRAHIEWKARERSREKTQLQNWASAGSASGFPELNEILLSITGCLEWRTRRFSLLTFSYYGPRRSQLATSRSGPESGSARWGSIGSGSQPPDVEVAQPDAVEGRGATTAPAQIASGRLFTLNSTNSDFASDTSSVWTSSVATISAGDVHNLVGTFNNEGLQWHSGGNPLADEFMIVDGANDQQSETSRSWFERPFREEIPALRSNFDEQLPSDSPKCATQLSAAILAACKSDSVPLARLISRLGRGVGLAGRYFDYATAASGGNASALSLQGQNVAGEDFKLLMSQLLWKSLAVNLQTQMEIVRRTVRLRGLRRKRSLSDKKLKVTHGHMSSDLPLRRPTSDPSPRLRSSDAEAPQNGAAASDVGGGESDCENVHMATQARDDIILGDMISNDGAVSTSDDSDESWGSADSSNGSSGNHLDRNVSRTIATFRSQVSPSEEAIGGQQPDSLRSCWGPTVRRPSQASILRRVYAVGERLEDSASCLTPIIYGLQSEDELCSVLDTLLKSPHKRLRVPLLLPEGSVEDVLGIGLSVGLETAYALALSSKTCPKCYELTAQSAEKMLGETVGNNCQNENDYFPGCPPTSRPMMSGSASRLHNPRSPLISSSGLQATNDGPSCRAETPPCSRCIIRKIRSLCAIFISVIYQGNTFDTHYLSPKSVYEYTLNALAKFHRSKVARFPGAFRRDLACGLIGGLLLGLGLRRWYTYCTRATIRRIIQECFNVAACFDVVEMKNNSLAGEQFSDRAFVPPLSREFEALNGHQRHQLRVRAMRLQVRRLRMGASPECTPANVPFICPSSFTRFPLTCFLLGCGLGCSEPRGSSDQIDLIRALCRASLPPTLQLNALEIFKAHSENPHIKSRTEPLQNLRCLDWGSPKGPKMILETDLATKSRSVASKHSKGFHPRSPEPGCGEMFGAAALTLGLLSNNRASERTAEIIQSLLRTVNTSHSRACSTFALGAVLGLALACRNTQSASSSLGSAEFVRRMTEVTKQLHLRARGFSVEQRTNSKPSPSGYDQLLMHFPKSDALTADETRPTPVITHGDTWATAPRLESETGGDARTAKKAACRSINRNDENDIHWCFKKPELLAALLVEENVPEVAQAEPPSEGLGVPLPYRPFAGYFHAVRPTLRRHSWDLDLIKPPIPKKARTLNNAPRERWMTNNRQSSTPVDVEICISATTLSSVLPIAVFVAGSKESGLVHQTDQSENKKGNDVRSTLQAAPGSSCPPAITSPLQEADEENSMEDATSRNLSTALQLANVFLLQGAEMYITAVAAGACEGSSSSVVKTFSPAAGTNSSVVPRAVKRDRNNRLLPRRQGFGKDEPLESTDGIQLLGNFSRNGEFLEPFSETWFKATAPAFFCAGVLLRSYGAAATRSNFDFMLQHWKTATRRILAQERNSPMASLAEHYFAAVAFMGAALAVSGHPSKFGRDRVELLQHALAFERYLQKLETQSVTATMAKSAPTLELITSRRVSTLRRYYRLALSIASLDYDPLPEAAADEVAFLLCGLNPNYWLPDWKRALGSKRPSKDMVLQPYGDWSQPNPLITGMILAGLRRSLFCA